VVFQRDLAETSPSADWNNTTIPSKERIFLQHSLRDSAHLLYPSPRRWYPRRILFGKNPLEVLPVKRKYLTQKGKLGLPEKNSPLCFSGGPDSPKIEVTAYPDDFWKDMDSCQTIR